MTGPGWPNVPVARDCDSPAAVGSLDQSSSPAGVELIAHALSFDRAALDRAIDQFFQQFDDLHSREFVVQGPAFLGLYTFALASTFAGLEVIRRRWGLTKRGKTLRIGPARDLAGPVGFPQLPGIWSSRSS